MRGFDITLLLTCLKHPSVTEHLMYDKIRFKLSKHGEICVLPQLGYM